MLSLKLLLATEPLSLALVSFASPNGQVLGKQMCFQFTSSNSVSRLIYTSVIEGTVTETNMCFSTDQDTNNVAKEYVSSSFTLCSRTILQQTIVMLDGFAIRCQVVIVCEGTVT